MTDVVRLTNATPRSTRRSSASPARSSASESLADKLKADRHRGGTGPRAGPVFGNDARQVIAFGAGRYAFMSARSMVKLDTNAGKPSLTPLH